MSSDTLRKENEDNDTKNARLNKLIKLVNKSLTDEWEMRPGRRIKPEEKKRKIEHVTETEEEDRGKEAVGSKKAGNMELEGKMEDKGNSQSGGRSNNDDNCEVKVGSNGISNGFSKTSTQNKEQYNVGRIENNSREKKVKIVDNKEIKQRIRLIDNQAFQKDFENGSTIRKKEIKERKDEGIRNKEKVSDHAYVKRGEENDAVEYENELISNEYTVTINLKKEMLASKRKFNLIKIYNLINTLSTTRFYSDFFVRPRAQVS